ncbi:MAG: coproporphyrinogen III oxidase family protein, partial [Verrucomicrobiae bacterium]|nr:coproporphyrinogen III oxidase family protein [Verrucomicrobiae bacterium]
DLSDVSEWTLEANPATFDLRKATLLRDLGTTRISLGVQSWQPSTLTTLGRDHSPADAEAAYEILREAGFSDVGIDLMFSVPGQTLEDWWADLAKVVSLQPEHISAYNLTYEEDTEFLKRHEAGELDTDEDRDSSLFELGIDHLEAEGYRHYEISNYARAGHESQHNQAYWSGADYLGIGPGAVSTVNGHRWKSLPDTAAWVSRVHSGDTIDVESEVIGPVERRIEGIALQLRTAIGLSESIVLDSPEPDLPDRVESLIEEGYLERTANECLRLTRAGKALADPIAAQLL